MFVPKGKRTVRWALALPLWGESGWGRSMKLELLADRPDAIQTIGGCYHATWGSRLYQSTLEQSIERLGGFLNREQMPLMLVATQDSEIIGAAQLKYREMKDVFPDLVHWLGGVYVVPSCRDQGIASRLCKAIATKAQALGVETLYLRTERLDGGLYAKLGWNPRQELRYHDLDVPLMERTLVAA